MGMLFVFWKYAAVNQKICFKFVFLMSSMRLNEHQGIIKVEF